MNTEDFTTVTYTLENGTRIAQPITKATLAPDNRGKRKSKQDLINLFSETAWDKGAVSFEIDSEQDTRPVVENEVHFSKLDKKLAKAQHKAFLKENSKQYLRNSQQYVSQLTEIIVKKRRIGMNLVVTQL